MNTRKLTLVSGMILSLLLCSGAIAKDENPFDISKRYPFKTAIIKSKLGGSTSGEQTLYVKNGKKADFTKGVTKVWGMKNEENKITLTTFDEIITIDLVKKVGGKTGNPTKYMSDEYKKLSPAEQKNVRQNVEKMGNNIMLQLNGGKPTQRRFGKFQGKDVEIVTIMGMTSYVWKGTDLLLKSTGKLMGVKVDTQAYSIQTDVAVDDNLFKVPAGIKVTYDQRSDAMLKDMAVTMIADLKNPDGGQNTGGKVMSNSMHNNMEQNQSIPSARRAQPVNDENIPVARRAQPVQEESSGFGGMFKNMF